jgi:proline iminopeptidase
MNDLYVCAAGTQSAGAPSLLFMHGGMGLDHACFRPFVEPLAADHHLVFYDHRLNGRSSRQDPERVTLASMADDASMIASAHGGAGVIPVAHSFGVWVALQLAAQRPDLVRGLVLVSPGFSATVAETLMRHVRTNGTAEQQQAFLNAFSGAMRTDEDYARAWDVIAPLYIAAEADATRLRTALDRVHFSLVGFTRFLAAGIGGLDWQASLAGFAGPVLVVGGSDDWMERDAGNSEAVSRVARRAQLAMLPGCGHFAFVERPDLFCDTVATWLDAAL